MMIGLSLEAETKTTITIIVNGKESIVLAKLKEKATDFEQWFFFANFPSKTPACICRTAQKHG